MEHNKLTLDLASKILRQEDLKSLAIDHIRNWFLVIVNGFNRPYNVAEMRTFWIVKTDNADQALDELSLRDDFWLTIAILHLGTLGIHNVAVSSSDPLVSQSIVGLKQYYAVVNVLPPNLLCWVTVQRIVDSVDK